MQIAYLVVVQLVSCTFSPTAKRAIENSLLENGLVHMKPIGVGAIQSLEHVRELKPPNSGFVEHNLVEKKAAESIVGPPKPLIEKQKSFKTKFNKNFEYQGQTSSCHVFATLEVIHDATNGLKLSKAKLFLDHLFSLEGQKVGVDAVIKHNLQEIERVRREFKGSKDCHKNIHWREGI